MPTIARPAIRAVRLACNIPGLNLRGFLFHWSSNKTRIATTQRSRLGVGTELVSTLVLNENTVRYHLLQRGQEHGIYPLTFTIPACLHCLLDGDDAGAITLLKHRNGGDDLCLVRHHDDNKEEKSDNG